MSCNDAEPFFDGELPEARTAAFRGHLAACERCQGKLDGLMQETVAASRDNTKRTKRTKRTKKR